MKRKVGVVLVALCVLLKAESKPRIGLVLSGGGALGFAHIGILEVLDSLGIPVDYVAGTSMGGIVGGLYSIGYSGKEIKKLVNSIDWVRIFEDRIPREELPYFSKKGQGRFQFEFGIENLRLVTKGGLISGQNIYLTLSRLTFPYEYIKDFDRLPIPFRCVAVDLISGRAVVLRRGSLAKAIRATMAVPTIFSPVIWGDSLLIDGGLVNNFPADVVREMGAEVVIGVFVFMPMKGKEDIKNTVDVFTQSYTIARNYNMRRNFKYVDVLVEVPLEGYYPIDFEINKIKEIIALGEKAAYRALPELVSLKEKYRLTRDVSHSSHIALYNRKAVITKITFTGRMSISFEEIRNYFGVKVGDVLDVDRLEQSIARLKALGRFKRAMYKIRPINEGEVELVLNLTEIRPPEIASVEIRGNKNFSASFIKRLLGIRSGEKLDIDRIEKRIRYLYSFGYFETITYELVPMYKDRVKLFVDVKEKYLSKISIGVRYDNRYNLVGVLDYQNTSLVIPGLRVEAELVGLGFSKFTFSVIYPSRSMGTPLYPALRVWSKNIPVFVYNHHGVKSSSYFDRSMGVSGGIGFLVGNKFNATFKFEREFIRIKPDIGVGDSLIFPFKRANKDRVSLVFEYDNLDDSFYPTKGMLFRSILAGYFPKGEGGAGWTIFSSRLKFYRTWRENTLMFLGFLGYAKDVPVYRHFHMGGSSDFLGVSYEQLTVNKLIFSRLDYNFALLKYARLFFSLNWAPYYAFELPTVRNAGHNLIGFGMGLTVSTPLGPVRLSVANGEKNIFRKGNRTFYFYFSTGIVL